MDILSFLAERFDLPILEWIAANLRCPFMDTIMPIITLLGDAGIFWIAIAALCLFFPKYRKMGLSMGISLLIGLLVCNVLLKPLVGRIRPYDYQLEHFGKQIQLLVAAQHDFSFPSGHTIASFEAATAIMLHNKKLGIVAMILAVMISFSRLYLYVHYPTDVIFSIILGTAFAFLGNYLAHKVFEKFPRKKSA